MKQDSPFPPLPRTPPRQPKIYSVESLTCLRAAYAKIHAAGDTGSHMWARQLVGEAADFLRRGGALDLAQMADRALDVAIGHPDVADLLIRIDERISGRSIRATGVI